MDGAVNVPAKLPPDVVETVVNVINVCDLSGLHIIVTWLPTGAAGFEDPIVVTWPENVAVLPAGKAGGRFSVV